MNRSIRLALLLLLSLLLPCAAQTEPADVAEPEVIRGFLFQNGITPESYVLTDAEQLKAFVATLPPTVPSKTVPAPPNKDPFLNGLQIDFEQSVVVIAVRRNGIDKHPVFESFEDLPDVRQVRFVVAAPTAEAYPFGWAVYSAMVLPKDEGPYQVVVRTAPGPRKSP